MHVHAYGMASGSAAIQKSVHFETILLRDLAPCALNPVEQWHLDKTYTPSYVSCSKSQNRLERYSTHIMIESYEGIIMFVGFK